MLLKTLLFTFIPMISIAQNAEIDNINWSSNRQIDILSGKISIVGGSLITYGSDSIVLNSRNLQSSLKMIIEKVSGSWQDVLLPGTIQFDVVVSGMKGTVTIKKTTVRTFARMLLTNKEGPQVTEFNITESRVLQ